LDRIAALKQKAFEQKGFDAFLVTNEFNMLYFAGFPGAASLLISRKDQNTLYVYNVNYMQAKTEAKGFTVELLKRGENMMERISKQVKTLKAKKLAVDALGYESYRDLAKRLRGNARLKTRGDLIWALRRVKTEDELALMRKAGELTSKGMKAAYETIRPSIREFEVAAEIEYSMRKNGSWGTAFETIVASGARSAYCHGGCTDREIRDGDLVVVDIGAADHFYRSDMTRTMVAGKPSPKQKKLYEVVKSAQEKAFQAIKAKAKGKDIDAAARRMIKEAGYGEDFCHGLGHGVGLEVHEPPSLSPQSKDTLVVGNVVTNEPGIYLAGFGGIRIEDTVLVQKPKSEKLTVGPYSLQAE